MEAFDMEPNVMGKPVEPGAGLSRSIARGESVEAELDSFIARRDAQRVRDEGERPEAAAWVESERRHSARRKAENEAAWCQYHQDQAARHRRTLEALIRDHEEAAARLGGAA